MSPPSDTSKAAPITGIRFALIFVGLALSIFLAALDQTIVATAIPKIGLEFQDFERVPWIGTAFLLTTAAFSPIYGKLADIFGRKMTFMFAITTFEVGSAICGAAVSMDMLIIGRAVAGVGGGGIFSLVLIIIADLVEFKDRGKFQGIIGACFGLASVVGPLVGGAFTDHLSWRWCFYINLPLGFVTIIVVLLFLNMPASLGSVREKIKRIDFLGSVVLIGAVVCILLPVQSGGTEWAWNAPQTIALFIVGGVLAIAFVLIELKFAAEPIIPASVFMNRSVPIIILMSALLGAAFISLSFYIPVFFQIVYGQTATQAGIAQIPLVLCVVFCSIASGLIVSRTGTYTVFYYVGFVLLGVGAYLVSLFDESSGSGPRIGFLVVCGCGIGLVIQMRIIGVQASVDRAHIAVATALTNFGQTLGGCLGLAIIGAIFNNQMRSGLTAASLPQALVDTVVQSPTAIYQIPGLPASTIATIVHVFVEADSYAMRCVIPFAGLAFLLSLGVKQYRQEFKAKPDAVKDDTVIIAEA
ncbi:major facilitator superfamily domain-containing protein [Polychytrium aggregatum]|uniref:major facilitator superfamily domain-containing protein n=1 Tax=Polychytrium aggregatum TaxID=110093 RepID=UPI0022FE401A|nr:major facilitator superfamily domain-containing protein [Polychytrium aggregatum]KAI9206211.1 major facilitator superfamily domain-containing protein [Polychytrium aggregatum]